METSVNGSDNEVNNLQVMVHINYKSKEWRERLAITYRRMNLILENTESDAQNRVRVQTAKEPLLLPKVNTYGSAKHYTGIISPYVTY
jgi:hypothetical protein